MLDLFLTRLLVPVLSFVLFVLVLYGALIMLLGLDRFDATTNAQETVRVIR